MTGIQELSLKNIADLLGKRARRMPCPQPDHKYCAAHGIDLHAPKPEFYVPPSLAELSSPQSGEAVFLFSAPAAVGKTSLARELQRQLTTPDRQVVYIPLKKAVIGHHFFSGLLSGLFPNASRKEILETLFSGNLVLIFDGYDEISLSSEQLELNLLFTQEIADACHEYVSASEQQGEVAPCILFLFRSVFFHFGIFNPLKTFARHLNVNFFNSGQRSEYLTRYLDANAEGPYNPKHLATPFLEAFEKQLAVASAEAEAFFGHAIVLSAFGDYLLSQEEANAMRLANYLRNAGVNDTVSTEVLQQIIETILTREISKFPNEPFSRALPGFEGYGVDLQEELLRRTAYFLAKNGATAADLSNAATELATHRLQAHSEFSALPPSAQVDIRIQYQEELLRKFEHHPFLDVTSKSGYVFRNPIYQEYYLAQFITSSPTILPSSLLYRGQSSHYLALFILALLPGREFASASPELLYYTLKLLSAATSGSEFEFAIEWVDEARHWQCLVLGENIQIAPFKYSNEILVLQLPRDAVFENFNIIVEWESESASNAMVSIRGAEGFDERSSTFVLRNASIAAKELELDAVRIRFDTVYLDCATLSLSQRVARIDGIHTASACPQHPLHLSASEYAVRSKWGEQLSALRSPQGDSLDSLKERLERVFLWFRKHGRVDYGVYDKRFDTVVLKKGRDADAQRLVDFLFSADFLSKDGQLIVLNQGKLAQYGMFYKQQNELQVSKDKFSQLHEQWLEYIKE